MSCYNGRNGALSVGGTNIAQLTAWTVSESADTIECSYMGQDWKMFKSGISMWEGSAEAVFADAGTALSAATLTVGTEVALVFYPDEGVAISYTGNAIVTSIETSADMEDVVRVSVAFQGTGALTKDLTV
jgi:predicted secreted protein